MPSRRETRGAREDDPGEPITIPAPGGPDTQNVVNQPQENYPQPGTGPKQPGVSQSYTQMAGESNEDFAARVEESEAEHAEQAEAQAAEEEDSGEE